MRIAGAYIAAQAEHPESDEDVKRRDEQTRVRRSTRVFRPGDYRTVAFFSSAI